VSFSPDGKRLVSTRRDGIAKVWDADNGDLLHACVGMTVPVLDAAYRPDGERLATGGGSLGEDVGRGPGKSPRLLGSLGVVYAVAYSPDGTRLASAGGRWGPLVKV
jgi:WD40 repeat protein